MKKTYYLVAALFVLCLALSAPVAFAQDDGAAAGGQAVMTIKDAKALDSGAEVVIQGMVTKELGAGKVAVEDGTGVMRVKVEKELWPGGKRAGDGVMVIFHGVLSKRGNMAEVEATKVEVQ